MYGRIAHGYSINKNDNLLTIICSQLMSNFDNFFNSFQKYIISSIKVKLCCISKHCLRKFKQISLIKIHDQ